MRNEQNWLNAIKKFPAWISGGISLATAIIGFVLLLQGNDRLGITVLVLLGMAALLFLCAYVAFARTDPLVEGGRGFYRFEKYRPWALIGFGFILGIAVSLLFFDQSRTFFISAVTGRDITTEARIPSANEASQGSSGQPQVGTGSFTSSVACFESYFADLPSERVATLENGAEGRVVLEADQTKGGISGILFSEFNQPIGAMRYHVIPSNDLFRIGSIVDAKCQEIADYSNVNNGGDKSALQSADPLQIELAGNQYVLDLIHDGSSVYAGFRKYVP